MNFEKFLSYSNLEEKTHQREGVEWCISREENYTYCRGGIIADEMGLGKTITMIATMMVNFKLPNLIVMPVVLLEQWKDQFQRTTGHTPLIYHGQVKKVLTKDQLQHIPIVLTTYGTVNSDAKHEKKLQGVRWSRVICDEAHHMRNKRSKIVSAMSSLHRTITWLITGTPIQNHINDLYSLFDVLKISNKVYTDIEKLRDIIDKVVLKRTKEQAGVEMPAIHLNRVTSRWTSVCEKKLSMDVHDKLAFSELDTKPVPHTMKLAMMMYARMMCVYPQLMTPHLDKLSELGIVEQDSLTGINHHSKLDEVVELVLKRKDNKNRKIIFTNFKTEADYLTVILQDKGLKVASIDGRITSKYKRKQLLNTSDLDVLILQIKTGNEGLNLQDYNEVYFITPQWNPKVEEQAIARCHRMGQKKDVHVFRFIMDNFDDDNRTSTSNIEMYTENIQDEKNKLEQKTMTPIITATV